MIERAQNDLPREPGLPLNPIVLSSVKNSSSSPVKHQTGQNVPDDVIQSQNIAFFLNKKEGVSRDCTPPALRLGGGSWNNSLCISRKYFYNLTMNFWQKIQRFIEPCRVYPFVTFLRFFTTSTTICFTLFLAYFLKEIVHSIETREMEAFLSTITKAGIIMVSFQIVGVILRNYYWVEQQFVWDKYFMRKSLKQFIRLDQ